MCEIYQNSLIEGLGRLTNGEKGFPRVDLSWWKTEMRASNQNSILYEYYNVKVKASKWRSYSIKLILCAKICYFYVLTHTSDLVWILEFVSTVLLGFVNF